MSSLKRGRLISANSKVVFSGNKVAAARSNPVLVELLRREPEIPRMRRIRLFYNSTIHPSIPIPRPHLTPNTYYSQQKVLEKMEEKTNRGIHKS
jgi:hypothetical protein